MTARTDVPSPAMTIGETRRLVEKDLPALPPRKVRGAGDYTAALEWLARAQGKDRPRLGHPRIAVFVQGGGGVEALARGLEPLAAAADADLNIYELGREEQKETGAGMTPHETAHALAYGMMAVQPGVDLAVLSAPGTAAGDLRAALEAGEDPLDALGARGCPCLAALAGCIVAARLARIPVLLDGAAAQTAAELLARINGDAAAHCMAAQDLPGGGTGLDTGLNGAFFIPMLKALAAA